MIQDNDEHKASRLHKLRQYARLYGWRRTFAKAAGRGDFPVLAPLLRKKSIDGAPGVSVIGCGQAAFSTLCYFLARSGVARFIHAYDTEPAKAQKLAATYGFQKATATAEELLQEPTTDVVYIASNHGSHAGYAITALQLGKQVFVEKPICTSWQQYSDLAAAAQRAPGKLYAGYNRPFAPAIVEVKSKLNGASKPLTLSCYVHGHHLPADHWYRNPGEGTRVCGNAGHWLDLFVHLLNTIHLQLPTSMIAQYLPADPAEPDDNFSLSLSTSTGDIFQLLLSARSEPFLGIRERIELQCGTFSASIDDFTRLTLYDSSTKTERRYAPKNVGHQAATLQPFAEAADRRDMREVWCSTRLMLHVADMAVNGTATMHIDLQSA